jgi:hypothetical protein
LAVTAQDADSGDTTTRVEILAQAGENAAELIRTEKPTQKPQAHLKGIEEMVGDKGYHSGAVVVNLQSAEVRTYIRRRSRPGKDIWKAKPRTSKRSMRTAGECRAPMRSARIGGEASCPSGISRTAAIWAE